MSDVKINWQKQSAFQKACKNEKQHFNGCNKLDGLNG